MSGYASRDHPSESVRQSLYARALAIDPGDGRRVVIIGTDLVGLPAEVADAAAARIGRQFGIERARLLLNSSHTHTGPVVYPNLAGMWDLAPDEERGQTRKGERHLLLSDGSKMGAATGQQTG